MEEQKSVWLVLLVLFIKNTMRTMERKRTKAALPRKIEQDFQAIIILLHLPEQKTSAFLEIGPNIM